MPKSNLEIIKDLYAAVGRGDGPAALSLMDPNIVWNEAESFPYADHNPYVGSAAVAEGIFFRLATEWDHFQLIPPSSSTPEKLPSSRAGTTASTRPQKLLSTRNSLISGVCATARSQNSSSTLIRRRRHE